MIAFAITCLLVATVFVALISATDSLMRGWHSYRALAAELRVLRQDQSATAPVSLPGSTRGAAVRPSRQTARHGRVAPARIRAAA